MKYVAFCEAFSTDVSVPFVMFCQSEVLFVRYHVVVSSKVILVKPLQHPKASSPMLFTLDGIVMRVKLLQ